MALKTDGMWMATSWSLLLILAIIISEPLLMVFGAIAWWTLCLPIGTGYGSGRAKGLIVVGNVLFCIIAKTMQFYILSHSCT